MTKTKKCAIVLIINLKKDENSGKEMLAMNTVICNSNFEYGYDNLAVQMYNYMSQCLSFVYSYKIAKVQSTV